MLFSGAPTLIEDVKTEASVGKKHWEGRCSGVPVINEAPFREMK